MAPKKRDVKTKRGKKGAHDDDGGPTSGGGGPSALAHDLDKPTLYIRPSDQLELTEEMLTEEITTILTANNPNAPKNIARYSYKERAYKFDPTVEQVATHFAMDGYILHRDGEEARRQAAMAEGPPLGADDQQQQMGASSASSVVRPLRNQFNFAERATQTYHNPSKERETMTEPPPSTNFSATATQWEIFDAYTEDIERNRTAKEKAGGKGRGKEDEKKDTTKVQAPDKRGTDDVIYSSSMENSLRIMERMVNQNNYDEISQDFKYYEDVSDQYKEEGTLLPLWKFTNDRLKKKHVTALCWNPEFPDLFAVGYGSYDFMKQGTGAVCCYTLKNACTYPEVSHPEYMFTTETGVTCLDFHPQHSSLIVVGCYDGTVMVFDVRSKINKPLFQSTAKSGKHTDPVWEVHWQEEDLAKNLNFFSISSDGRVTLWTLSKNELQHTDVLHLKLESTEQRGGDDDNAALSGLAGGCCFDFNRFSEHLFVVGTEEGKIHKCSKAYNSQYLLSYEGHYMNVYSTRWNPFHPKVFISASADWTVKIWDHSQPQPLMSFDLNNAVGDVAWAPYASTTFAAVTDDGKVHVFDLKESKHEPLCEQQVVKKAKLTHVCFNPKEPILLIGDDRGNVTALKLSPNLRKPALAPQQTQAKGARAAQVQTTEATMSPEEREKEKLEKILNLGEKEA